MVRGLFVLLAAWLALGSVAQAQTAAPPSRFAGWALAIVAADWRDGANRPIQAFDNARLDLVKGFLAAGFPRGNMVDYSLRPDVAQPSESQLFVGTDMQLRLPMLRFTCAGLTECRCRVKRTYKEHFELEGRNAMLSGGCHCGAVRYQMPEAVGHHALCHCTDCRKASGAPAVAWALAPTDQIAITGDTRAYESSEHGCRYFCGRCGTSLFYTNDAIFPGMTDVQSATLDDPDALPLQAQIQTAERIGWMAAAHELPSFDRYPGPPEA